MKYYLPFEHSIADHAVPQYSGASNSVSVVTTAVAGTRNIKQGTQEIVRCLFADIGR